MTTEKISTPNTPGKRFAQFREALNQTQTELAGELNIPIKELIAIEQDQLDPSLHTIHHLHHHRRLDFNWFVSGAGNMFLTDQQSDTTPPRP